MLGNTSKLENILKGSLDSIPSPSVKIQIMGGKVIAGNCLQTFENKEFVLTTPSNVLPLHHKQTFLPMIRIFTEGDGIESRLPFKIFITLSNAPLLITDLPNS